MARRLPSLRAFSAQPCVLGGDVAGLALEIGAERDHLVAGIPCDLGRGIQRRLRPCDQFELRARKRGIARLAALVVRIVERAANGVVDREIIFRNDGTRVGQRGRIGHGRPGCDRGGIVVRHVGDRERHDLGALSGARQPAALDPRQMLSDDIHLADRRAGAQQRAVDLLLLRERHAVGRRDPVGGAAARYQHQQKIVRGRLLRQSQGVVGALQSGLVGHGMAGFDHPDAPGRHAMAVAGGGDAQEPRRLQFERVEIMPFRGRGQRGSALAGGKADHPAFRHRAQMPAQHDVGMRGGDGRIEDRAQERASVGHRLHGNFSGTGGPVIHPIAAKENPRGLPAGALQAANRPIGFARTVGRVMALAAGVTGEDFAETFPGLALELDQLHLRDRSKVGRPTC